MSVRYPPVYAHTPIFLDGYCPIMPRFLRRQVRIRPVFRILVPDYSTRQIMSFHERQRSDSDRNNKITIPKPFFLGPPSFSNPAPAPNNGPVGPNNVGLMSPGPHQQQPNRPMMSPTSSSGPPTSNSDFQPSYNGTELVMLYDYKVS